jgi:hypothetical protein
MNKNFVTIVALSIDSRHAVLYKEDGSTLTIPQGDARLPRIVKQSKFELKNGVPATVDITPVVIQRTEFPDAEKGTKGVIKFFRVAKSFLKSLVNTESPEAVPEEVAHVSPLEIGVFPGKEATNQGTKEEDAPADPTPAVADAAPVQADQKGPGFFVNTAVGDPNATTGQSQAALTNDQKLDAARERMHQLVSNSVGTSQAEFHTPLDEQTETIVAVHEKTGAIIPDAHKLARQLRSSQKLENYVGFERFIERLSAIIDQRGHSVEDLMKFIEKGDLPIADDGCIVIYKRLNSRGDHFVDVHTGKIPQKVGSYVFMRAGLVDPNRRQDCSNGLHVASLSYLNAFSGNVTVIAKVRPEDVFAVPQYAHNKMRVCGYHILANLSNNLRDIVNRGGSISSDAEGARLLANVLKGNHVGISQHVEIGGHQGENVTVTKVANAVSADQLPALKLDTAQTLDMQEALEAKAPVAPEIKAKDLISAPAEKVLINIMSSDPKETSGEVANKSVQTEGKLSQKEKAAQLLHIAQTAMSFPAEVAAVKALVEFRKSTRKGWSALGIDAGDVLHIERVLGLEYKPVNAPKPVKAPSKGSKKVQKAETPSKISPQDKAYTLLAQGLSNIEVANQTGLSKDQVYRLKKKLPK